VRKAVAAVVGAILLLAGVGVGVAHYLLDSGDTMRFITLAVAAVLLVAGLTLLNWGKEVFRR